MNSENPKKVSNMSIKITKIGQLDHYGMHGDVIYPRREATGGWENSPTVAEGVKDRLEGLLSGIFVDPKYWFDWDGSHDAEVFTQDISFSRGRVKIFLENNRPSTVFSYFHLKTSKGVLEFEVCAAAPSYREQWYNS